jgi:WD40 repeat protein
MAITKRVKASKVKVNDVKFSPNGKLLAAGSNDGTIEIFSVDAEYQKITSLTVMSAL